MLNLIPEPTCAQLGFGEYCLIPTNNFVNQMVELGLILIINLWLMSIIIFILMSTKRLQLKEKVKQK